MIYSADKGAKIYLVKLIKTKNLVIVKHNIYQLRIKKLKEYLKIILMHSMNFYIHNMYIILIVTQYFRPD